MKNNKKALLLVMILFITSIFSGCKKVDDLKVKFGFKNTDFEYIAENKVEKIIIQSTRDQGFKCVVTDKRTIENIHDILSSAKVAEDKTSLQPDYVFEIHEWGKEPHKFNYVVGVQEKGVGNFYADKAYVVSKRIDNDIIRNLSVLRKPREFGVLYYDVIFKFLDQYKETLDSSAKIGINIGDDVEIAKYILSTDLEHFKEQLEKKYPNIKLVDKNKEDFQVLINIKTYGYKEKIYKNIITVKDSKNNKETKYYGLCKIEDNIWNISISDKKPEEF